MTDPARTTPAQPQTDTAVAQTVCTMFTDVLGLTVQPQDKIQHLASIDSLQLMRIIERIEDRFHVLIDDEQVFTATTVADLIRIVESAQDAA